MKRSPFRFALLACTLVAASASAQSDKVHEGQWEMTTQITITGSPYQIPPSTHTQCVTKKDMVPHPPQKDGSKCDISTVKSEGHKVSWTIKCSGPKSVEGTGEITYSGDTMEGHSNFKMSNPRTGQPMEAQQTITGHRVGDCPK